VAVELGPFGPLVIFAVGTGVRPEEAFGADWTDVDVDEGVLRVRRAFAKGRLKTYTKTGRSRRRVPLRGKVVAALEELPRRHRPLFPNAVGGRIDINNWRSREWARRSRLPGSSIGGSTTCATRSRRGAWRPG
jgi:integrase